jgi:hypothetical protein
MIASDKPKAESELGVPDITDETVRQWVQHEFGTPWPEIPRQIIPDIEPSDQDQAIAERLLAAYAACLREEENHPSIGADLWSGIRKLQGSFLSVLASRNPKELAGYLCNMARRDATIGITQGDGEHGWITTSPEYAEFRALLIKDKLVSFAEAVAAIRCECPEQGPWGAHLYADLDALFRSLEDEVGISLAPPPIDGGLFKIHAAGAWIHDRDLHAQFAAWSMRELAGPSATVCELGAGVGRAAYWAYRFGLGAYTIFDLPHVNLLQGFYLLKSVPMDQVQLFGETVENPIVTVRPYFETTSVKPGEIDIIFTQDSLPEIHRESALRYIKWARDISPQWFYSINQEAAEAYTQSFGAPGGETDPRQNVVSALMSEVTGFRRVMRVPYWLRKGYVSELYKVQP